MRRIKMDKLLDSLIEEQQAVLFGEYDNLVGVAKIVKSGSSLDCIANKTAMIMLTPGMLHNVGPYRLHVDLANQLAKQGISSLRFDLSGIGDSLGVGTSGKSIERAAFETSQAMNYLTDKYGFESYILFGLCSGADDGIQTALFDKRVKGVINLDGLGYKTLEFKIRENLLLLRKMLYPSKWIRKAQGLLNAKLAPASLAMGGDIREFPDDTEQASHDLQVLTDRKTQLHFIYTGGTLYYNYAKQFYDMLPKVNWKGNESTRYFPQMDHVVTLCEDRQLLIDHITDKTEQMIGVIKNV